MSFNKLFALEWVKLYSRRTLIYFLVYLLLATTLTFLIFGLFGLPPENGKYLIDLETLNPFGGLLGSFSTPLALTASLFFIMQSGDEYKFGVVRKNVIDGMSRDDVFNGKMVFLFGSYLGWTLLLFLVFLVIGTVRLSDNISGLFASINYNQVIKFILFLFFYGALSHFLITLTKSSTVSILILLGLSFFESIAVQVLNAFDYQYISKHLPFETAGFIRTADRVGDERLAVFLAYILFFIGFSHWLFKKRDL